jgi:hypothetical protein
MIKRREINYYRISLINPEKSLSLQVISNLRFHANEKIRSASKKDLSVSPIVLGFAGLYAANLGVRSRP